MNILRPGEHEGLLSPSIFLAGPTPRDDQKSWREEAIELLSRQFEGSLLVPEPFCNDYDAQVKWEWKYLDAATCILFWVPRSRSLPGFTTNTEFGMYASSGKIVLGAPPKTYKTRYLFSLADRFDVPCADTLDHTVELAIEMTNKKQYKPLYITLDTKAGGEPYSPPCDFCENTSTDRINDYNVCGNCYGLGLL